MNFVFVKDIINGKACTKGVLVFGLFWVSSVAQAAEFPDSGDLAAGAKTWVENCTRCHNLRAPNELRDDEWITSVFHMRIRAGLTGKETRDVLTFLQAANATNAVTSVQSEEGEIGKNQEQIAKK